jgi:hypothetical protein
VSSKAMLQRLAVVGIGSAAAVFALLASPSGVASAMPDECNLFGECMPDIPPEQPHHMPNYPKPQYAGNYYPDYEVCLSAANSIECLESGPR